MNNKDGIVPETPLEKLFVELRQAVRTYVNNVGIVHVGTDEGTTESYLTLENSLQMIRILNLHMAYWDQRLELSEHEAGNESISESLSRAQAMGLQQGYDLAQTDHKKLSVIKNAAKKPTVQ